VKWVVYALLLTNLGVFVWYYQHVPETAPRTSVVDKANDNASLSLVLLREYGQKPEEKPSGRQCFSLGPFENKKQAGSASKLLKAGSIKAKIVMRKDARRKAYWVLLAPAESRKAAKKDIKRLKKLNITDYFLVATGEMANAISLGVFTQFESAHRRIKQMQGLGFTPRFEKVDLPKREYWLDWPEDGGISLSDVALQRVRKIREIIKVRTLDCSQ